jgi:hypothetical protein
MKLIYFHDDARPRQVDPFGLIATAKHFVC